MPTDLERRRAIDTAASMYLAEEPLDMSLLAERLGVGRATLYRWVGNRDELLGTVLAEATERTYRKAMSQASGQGLEYILDVFGRVMRSVESSTELRAKIGRASCRERVCQSVLISVVADSLKKKNLNNRLKCHH